MLHLTGKCTHRPKVLFPSLEDDTKTSNRVCSPVDLTADYSHRTKTTLQNMDMQPVVDQLLCDHPLGSAVRPLPSGWRGGGARAILPTVSEMPHFLPLCVFVEIPRTNRCGRIFLKRRSSLSVCKVEAMTWQSSWSLNEELGEPCASEPHGSTISGLPAEGF